MRNWLLKKLSRQRLDEFTKAKASADFVLEIRALFKRDRALYPNSIAGDLLYYPQLDLQFDSHQLPFADKSFPTNVCSEVLEHCKEPQKAIAECYRILQEIAQMILTTGFIFPIHNAPHDYFRNMRNGLKSLMRHFSNIDLQIETAFIETLGILLQGLTYQASWRFALTKIILQLMAHVSLLLQGNLKAEYGDISNSYTVQRIMTSGYYIVAKK